MTRKETDLSTGSHKLKTNPLARLGAWLSRVAGEAVVWVAGIVGFLMLRAALAALFPDAAWNPFG